MSKIKDVFGYEILDSRGNPTVCVELTLDNGIKGIASVPSGASTGIHEALELRDNDKNRYNGKGVLNAISNINGPIRELVLGMDPANQKELDMAMIKLDGTNDKSRLGANAILGVSLANLKAASLDSGKELYEYLGNGTTMPRCMMNILNGGAHATNGLDIQEFMIVPSKEDYADNLRMGSEIFHSLKKLLDTMELNCGVGDEGGFAPNISNSLEALELLSKAISSANYVLGRDVYLAMDAAASEFYEDGVYNFEGKKMTSDEMIDFYTSIIDKYSIISIEDGLSEDDYAGWTELTKRLGNKIQLVGDDLFVTNKELLQKGIDLKMANAILLKLNQIGTVSETLETIKLAKDNGYKTIISHRSGETEDNYIADFAVGLDLGQIKTGSVSRGERTSKYNRLIRINIDLNNRQN